MHGGETMSVPTYTTELGDLLLSLQGVAWRDPERVRSMCSVDAWVPAFRSVERAPRDAGIQPHRHRHVTLISMVVAFAPEVEHAPREQAMTAIGAGAAEVLRAGDHVHRVGVEELSFRLYDTDETGAEVAMIRVEARARRRLAERGLPAPRFDVVPVDPGVVIGASA